MRIIRKLPGLAVAVALVALPTAPARAGSYVVSACSPTSSPGPWVATNTFPASLATGNLCNGDDPAIEPVDGGEQGGLYAGDILGAPGDIPDVSRAGWTFSAPPGATITGVSYFRSLSTYANSNMFAGLYQADGAALEECKIEIPMGSRLECESPNIELPAIFTGLTTSSLFLGVRCHIVVAGQACGARAAPHHAMHAVMYSARVTLSENSAPTVTSVGGALWIPGVVSGVAPVTFAASDVTGIKDLAVVSDTRPTIVSVPQACDFTRVQPCPQVPSGSLSVDTRRVPDGPHTFSLVVTDAAGNSQVVTSPTVVVDNNGPTAPTAFTATAKGGGSNGIALAWRNPSNPPAPVTAAMVQLCAGSCPPAVTVSSSGAAQITAPGPGLYSVRLWLLDDQGRGGSHNAALASVRVPTAGSGTSPIRTKISAVLKGRLLRVSGTMARTGRVKVSWRSKLRGRTLGSGSRMVTIRKHKISTTFTLSTRVRRGTTRVAIRSGRRIVAQARARRAS